MTSTVYQCTYTDGGGTEHDGGEWSMKETAKTYTFTLIEKPWFDNLGKSKLTLYKTGSPRGNPFEEWSGKRFLVYPDQRGIPYFFEPIIEADGEPSRNPCELQRESSELRKLQHNNDERFYNNIRLGESEE